MVLLNIFQETRPNSNSKWFIKDIQSYPILQTWMKGFHILSQEVNQSYGKTITPFHLSAAIAISVGLNCSLVLLKLNKSLIITALVKCTIASISCSMTFVLVHILSYGSKLTTESKKWLRLWKNSKLNPYEKRINRSLRSLSFNLGPFFRVQKIMAFSAVLAIIRYTGKGLIFLSWMNECNYVFLYDSGKTNAAILHLPFPLWSR